MVFLGRALDRSGKGIRQAPRDALIAEKRGRAYGLHRAMDTTGAALGIILAIYLLWEFYPYLSHLINSCHLGRYRPISGKREEKDSGEEGRKIIHIEELEKSPAGTLSDKVGRKSLVVSGYLVYGLVYLGFGLADKLFYLIPLFSVYGLYSAFTEGVEKVFVSDIAPERIRGV